MSLIHQLDHTKADFSKETQNESIHALETGHVIYLPKMGFQLLSSENVLLSPDFVLKGTKNISFDPNRNKIKGIDHSSNSQLAMSDMMQRYVGFASDLIKRLFPYYYENIQLGKTSYRPVEVYGRLSSYRKDDTRLHVDAFPSNPNHGKRILRVFSNINPNNQSRHWKLGENFEDVASRFLGQIPKPFWGSKYLLNLIGATKSVRSDYDYYMNQLHNRMKSDENYQKTVDQVEVHFPPQTTWIVMTDSVSHAALGGQYLLEQTFYLPAKAMLQPQYSPLEILEGLMGKKLA